MIITTSYSSFQYDQLAEQLAPTSFLTLEDSNSSVMHNDNDMSDACVNDPTIMQLVHINVYNLPRTDEENISTRLSSTP